jgi:hypothetical protein
VKQPIAGIKGLKPRPAKISGNGELSKQESRELDREYRVQRNKQLAMKNEREKMAFQKARGELIEKRLAVWQLGSLLTAFRERLLATPVKLVRKLIRAGFIEEAGGFEAEKAIKGDLVVLLNELADLPQALGGPAPAPKAAAKKKPPKHVTA